MPYFLHRKSRNDQLTCFEHFIFYFSATDLSFLHFFLKKQLTHIPYHPTLLFSVHSDDFLEIFRVYVHESLGIFSKKREVSGKIKCSKQVNRSFLDFLWRKYGIHSSFRILGISRQKAFSARIGAQIRRPRVVRKVPRVLVLSFLDFQKA